MWAGGYKVVLLKRGGGGGSRRRRRRKQKKNACRGACALRFVFASAGAPPLHTHWYKLRRSIGQQTRFRVRGVERRRREEEEKEASAAGFGGGGGERRRTGRALTDARSALRSASPCSTACPACPPVPVACAFGSLGRFECLNVRAWGEREKGGRRRRRDEASKRRPLSLTLRVYELSSQPVMTPTAKVTVSVAATLPASCMAAPGEAPRADRLRARESERRPRKAAAAGGGGPSDVFAFARWFCVLAVEREEGEAAAVLATIVVVRNPIGAGAWCSGGVVFVFTEGGGGFWWRTRGQ